MKRQLLMNMIQKIFDEKSKFVGSNHLYRYISYFFTEVQDHSLHEY